MYLTVNMIGDRERRPLQVPLERVRILSHRASCRHPLLAGLLQGRWLSTTQLRLSFSGLSQTRFAYWRPV
jgi:hypothetical protein